MPRLEIVPFADEHLDEAAQLLAGRHRRHRAAEPLLPRRFEEPAAAGAEVGRVWRAEATGAAAFRGGRMVGYLVGAPRKEPVWGDNVWVELPGHAVEEAEVARDLYARAAGEWFAAGRTRHYVLVPAHDDPLIERWFALSFGQQQAHALRELPDHTDAAVPDGFEIRAPEPGEVEALIELDLALPMHHRTAPIFSTVPPPSRDASRDEWLETFAGDAEKILIGARNGRPVACWALMPFEDEGVEVGLMAPRDACFLHFAVTLPGERGHGLGVALTDAAFAWAREAGYTTMVTDWRVTNLLASRFWPRRGFRTAFLRLYRHIP
jgi:GNAT superfamily N-acetyltransferase